MPGRYVSFYEDALTGFAGWHDMDALSVFFAICKHCNSFGWCDPGDELLGNLCGYRRDTTIPALLERLQAADLIHVTETTVPFRTKPLRGIQVNPCVIRLRDENHASAMADWLRYIPQTNASNEIQTTPIISASNDRQPDQNQNQPLNQSQNQNRNQQKNQRKTTFEEGDQVLTPFSQLTPEGQEQSEGQDSARSAQESKTTRAASASNSSAAPRPSEPRSLQRYKSPLPSPTDDDLAMELVNLTQDLSRENARMLVDTYGYEQVMRASLLYRHHTGTVKHPGRWVRAMLRKGADELWKEQPFDHYREKTGD